MNESHYILMIFYFSKTIMIIGYLNIIHITQLISLKFNKCDFEDEERANKNVTKIHREKTRAMNVPETTSPINII